MLKDEIQLNRDFESPQEELFLDFFYTAQKVEEAAKNFLKTYQLNPTQFNALMIIRDYQKEGIRQSELSQRLLINAASTGTLIDRLQKMGLIDRLAVSGDRRAYHLELTKKGSVLLQEILEKYYPLMNSIFACTGSEQEASLKFLDRLRSRVQEI